MSASSPACLVRHPRLDRGSLAGAGWPISSAMTKGFKSVMTKGNVLLIKFK